MDTTAKESLSISFAIFLPILTHQSSFLPFLLLCLFWLVFLFIIQHLPIHLNHFLSVHLHTVIFYHFIFELGFSDALTDLVLMVSKLKVRALSTEKLNLHGFRLIF